MAQKRALAFRMLVYWLAKDLSRDLALYTYEGWNFNSGNYLFTTDTK